MIDRNMLTASAKRRRIGDVEGTGAGGGIVRKAPMDMCSQRLRDETLFARAQAERLLADLLACQASGDTACRDLYKQVTGQSSLEKAIDEARRLVASHERLLLQIGKDQSDKSDGVPVIAARLGPRVTRQAMAGR